MITAHVQPKSIAYNVVLRMLNPYQSARKRCEIHDMMLSHVTFRNKIENVIAERALNICVS
jgi:hypothetical protein